MSREEFEKYPSVIERLRLCYFDEKLQCYVSYQKFNYASAAYLNGAWYTYQEQKKEIDEYNSKVRKFIKELERSWSDDKDSVHDFWRGFAECAGASKEVFLRDVGEIK